MRILGMMCVLFVVAACGGGGASGGGGSGGSGENPETPGTFPPPIPIPGDVSAAAFAAKMGRPNRLQVGLGSSDITDIQGQGLAIDIHERYLPDQGPGNSWVEFVSPDGAYIGEVTAEADSVGAVPMFTLYAMAIKGDGDLTLLDDQRLMTYYWSHVVLLFDRLGAYDKPALVNLEPDFWGYVHNATDGDPTARFAHVKVTPDCASLPNDVAGVAQCLMRIARNRAPKVLLGFPPADFSFGPAETIAFMNRIGAQNADFIVQQTLDRDAGCFEARSSVGDCDGRVERNPYWNQAAFTAHFAEVRRYHQGIGGLPVVWWQTPMGLPSTSFGTAGRFRDNRLNYFLSHPAELVAAGGVAAVFSAGQIRQTDVTTDGGQFKNALGAYLANPEPLPAP